MIGFALALGLPFAALVAGRALANRPAAGTAAQVALGFVAPPLLVAWRRRSFAEQVAAYALHLVIVGGTTVARDPSISVAFGLLGASWAIWLALGAAGTTAAANRIADASAATRVVGPPTRSPAASARQTAAKAEEKEPEAAAFRIGLACPTCGAEILTPVYHHMARCDWCSSCHMVVRPERLLVTVLPDNTPDAIRRHAAVLGHFRHLRFLELYDRIVRPLVEQSSMQARASDGEGPGLTGNPIAMAAVNAASERAERQADDYAASIAPDVVVNEAIGFLAPYWHRSGTLYQVGFGRDQAGDKRMAFAINQLETVVPASAARLPDMGKLSYLRALHPLLGAPEASLPSLPIEVGEDALEDRLSQLSQRTIDLPVSALARRSTFVPEARALVYRPFYVVSGALRGRPFAFLLDACAASVAGPPPRIATDLSSVEASGSAPRLVPSRCPECGADLPFAPDAVAHLCGSCFRLVEMSGGRWRTRRYLRERARPGTWSVPFWRFPIHLRDASGRVVVDLAHLTDGVDGTLDQVGDREQVAGRFFVPAFRTRLNRAGVRLYRRLWPLVQGRALPLENERFSASEPPGPTVDVALAPDEARVFARSYLALAFTPRDLARADVHRVRETFLAAEIGGDPELTFLALPTEAIEPHRAAIGRTRAQAIADLEGNRVGR